ncbi:MAG: lamin tail domain-containing protein [Anaerolineales bacterium]
MQKRNIFSRVVLIVTLFALIGAGMFSTRVNSVGAAPAKVVLPGDVLISEFRFLGPTGADDEFIELYNPKSTSVDLTGLKIMGSNNAGATGTRVTLGSVVLLPGQYYLIVNSGASAGLLALQNTTYATDITADGGVAITLNDGVTVIDQVGLSVGSAYKEGTILAPLAGTANQSYERKLGGALSNCVDTNNNFSDFIWNNTSSNPQNMASPLVACPPPTSTPTITDTPSQTLTPSNTPTPTSTGTATSTSTSTSTSTPTATNTSTITPAGLQTVLISEIAWAGTAASSSDEWIELRNPGAVAINITGWVLKSSDGTPNIILSGTIPAGGYFLLERYTDASDIDATVSNITADQLYVNNALSNTGESLSLYDASNTLIDTANANGGSWPAGSSTTFGTMERIGTLPDSDSAWSTNTGLVKNGEDANGAALLGTPKNGNSPTPTPTLTPSVTLTKAPTNTKTPTRTRTPTRTPTRTKTPTVVPLSRPIINEFLPRPGFDWNQDGKVDVFDEFIEIKNIGAAEINLNGWQLDDEANLGSNPYVIQNLVLKPGERAVFYGLQTNILQSDGGDTIRLLNPSGKVYDSYTYKIAKTADASICRLPDGNGSWYEDCVPTPNLTNTRQGKAPSAPSGVEVESPLCDLPDTLHPAFFFAECRGYGAKIWSSFYWDNGGWFGDFIVPENQSKQNSFVE